jgi:hypothetical protein
MPDTPDIPPKTPAPLWKRIRAWTIIVLLYAAIAAMAVYGCVVLYRAFKPGLPLDDRFAHIFAAAALLLIPAFLIRVFLRNKWTTGRWFPPRSQTSYASQCSINRSRTTQSPPWSWFGYAADWANHSAFNAALPLWRRIAGWTLLIAFAAILLACTGVSILFIGAGLDTVRTGGLIMIFFGLVLLLYPILAARSYFRRWRNTGTVLIPLSELEQARARQSQSFERERQKPLRTKIISTIIALIGLTYWWFRETLFHTRHPHESWVTPAMWTVFFAYATWNQFRKPKNPSPTSQPTT